MIIWKYKIEMTGWQQYISMPKGAEVVSFQLQDGVPHIWVSVPDVYAIKEPKCFRLVPTGEDFYQVPGKFHGTIQLKGFVWHLYEEFSL